MAVAAAMPTLDLVTVSGHPSAAHGDAVGHLAPVLRLEHR